MNVLCLQKNVPTAFTGQPSRAPGSRRESKSEEPGLGDKKGILLINATYLHLGGGGEDGFTSFSFDLLKYMYQVSAGICIPYVGK